MDISFFVLFSDFSGVRIWRSVFSPQRTKPLKKRGKYGTSGSIGALFFKWAGVIFFTLLMILVQECNNSVTNNRLVPKRLLQKNCFDIVKSFLSFVVLEQATSNLLNANRSWSKCFNISRNKNGILWKVCFPDIPNLSFHKNQPP